MTQLIEPGERVVHKVGDGRIRGEVDAVHIDKSGVRYFVRVDGLNGRIYDYVAKNIVRESEWQRTPHDRRNDSGETE